MSKIREKNKHLIDIPTILRRLGEYKYPPSCIHDLEDMSTSVKEKRANLTGLIADKINNT
jgi:hypothetical protein